LCGSGVFNEWPLMRATEVLANLLTHRQRQRVLANHAHRGQAYIERHRTIMTICH